MFEENNSQIKSDENLRKYFSNIIKNNNFIKKNLNKVLERIKEKIIGGSASWEEEWSFEEEEEACLRAVFNTVTKTVTVKRDIIGRGEVQRGERVQMSIEGGGGDEGTRGLEGMEVYGEDVNLVLRKDEIKAGDKSKIKRKRGLVKYIGNKRLRKEVLHSGGKRKCLISQSKVHEQIKEKRNKKVTKNKKSVEKDLTSENKIEVKKKKRVRKNHKIIEEHKIEVTIGEDRESTSLEINDKVIKARNKTRMKCVKRRSKIQRKLKEKVNKKVLQNKAEKAKIFKSENKVEMDRKERNIIEIEKEIKEINIKDKFIITREERVRKYVRRRSKVQRKLEKVKVIINEVTEKDDLKSGNAIDIDFKERNINANFEINRANANQKDQKENEGHRILDGGKVDRCFKKDKIERDVLGSDRVIIVSSKRGRKRLRQQIEADVEVQESTNKELVAEKDLKCQEKINLDIKERITNIKIYEEDEYEREQNKRYARMTIDEDAKGKIGKIGSGIEEISGNNKVVIASGKPKKERIKRRSKVNEKMITDEVTKEKYVKCEDNVMLDIKEINLNKDVKIDEGGGFEKYKRGEATFKIDRAGNEMHIKINKEKRDFEARDRNDMAIVDDGRKANSELKIKIRIQRGVNENKYEKINIIEVDNEIKNKAEFEIKEKNFIEEMMINNGIEYDDDLKNNNEQTRIFENYENRRLRMEDTVDKEIERNERNEKISLNKLEDQNSIRIDSKICRFKTTKCENKENDLEEKTREVFESEQTKWQVNAIKEENSIIKDNKVEEHILENSLTNSVIIDMIKIYETNINREFVNNRDVEMREKRYIMGGSNENKTLIDRQYENRIIDIGLKNKIGMIEWNNIESEKERMVKGGYEEMYNSLEIRHRDNSVAKELNIKGIENDHKETNKIEEEMKECMKNHFWNLSLKKTNKSNKDLKAILKETSQKEESGSIPIMELRKSHMQVNNEEFTKQTCSKSVSKEEKNISLELKEYDNNDNEEERLFKCNSLDEASTSMNRSKNEENTNENKKEYIFENNNFYTKYLNCDIDFNNRKDSNNDLKIEYVALVNVNKYNESDLAKGESSALKEVLNNNFKEISLEKNNFRGDPLKFVEEIKNNKMQESEAELYKDIVLAKEEAISLSENFKMKNYNNESRVNEGEIENNNKGEEVLRIENDESIIGNRKFIVEYSNKVEEGEINFNGVIEKENECYSDSFSSDSSLSNLTITLCNLTKRCKAKKRMVENCKNNEGLQISMMTKKRRSKKTKEIDYCDSVIDNFDILTYHDTFEEYLPCHKTKYKGTEINKSSLTKDVFNLTRKEKMRMILEDKEKRNNKLDIHCFNEVSPQKLM